jgi:predicted esterase
VVQVGFTRRGSMPRSLDTVLIRAADESSRRLWVMLHGLGDSVDGYRWMPEEFRLPGMNYLLVNAPEMYFGGYSWFEFTDDGDPEVMRPGVERSARRVFRARRRFSVDSPRAA